MPSGSKKRKAAKKKKENPPNHPPSLASARQSLGSDDVTHQEDDSSQVSSPASSQDPPTHQNPSMGDEEETIHGEKIVTDAPSKVLDKNAVPIEDEDTTKRSCGGDSSRTSSSSGSSSSSSDDESHIVKSNQAVKHVAPVPESLSEVKGETGNNVVIEDAVASEAVVQNAGAVVHDRTEVAEVTKEEKLNPFEDKASISTIANDMSASEPTEGASIQSNEKIATISNPQGDLSQGTDDHSIMSYNVPVGAPENGANNLRDLGVAEPVVRADPHPVQTTSWKGCCGLFEVFTGSSR